VDTKDEDYSANAARFSGFADLYDRYRPQPPAVLVEVLVRLTGSKQPELVVDLGCGTGLSTRYWAGRSKKVIGIDPSADMRAQAEAQTQAAHVIYLNGLSHHTGLPEGCADLVTCSQALHWMEPQGTFLEARRILRPGGVFAAYDYDWPPETGEWEADQAFETCIKHVHAVEKEMTPVSSLKRWEKGQHLARMRESGNFRYTRELVLHHIEIGSAERLVGVLLSQGSVMDLLKAGVSRTRLGIDHFERIVRKVLGPGEQTWFWSSRVRLGIV
jgi:SAM-dependent methyltransferase